MDNDQKIEQEIVKLYNLFLSQNRVLETNFQCPRAHIDMKVAWQVFEEIAYKEIFRHTKGNWEVLPGLATDIYETVLSLWPPKYYLQKLEDAGAIYNFDGVYAVKEAHRDILKTILIE